MQEREHEKRIGFGGASPAPTYLATPLYLSYFHYHQWIPLLSLKTMIMVLMMKTKAPDTKELFVGAGFSSSSAYLATPVYLSYFHHQCSGGFLLLCTKTTHLTLALL